MAALAIPHSRENGLRNIKIRHALDMRVVSKCPTRAWELSKERHRARPTWDRQTNNALGGQVCQGRSCKCSSATLGSWHAWVGWALGCCPVNPPGVQSTYHEGATKGKVHTPSHKNQSALGLNSRITLADKCSANQCWGSWARTRTTVQARACAQTYSKEHLNSDAKTLREECIIQLAGARKTPIEREE